MLRRLCSASNDRHLMPRASRQQQWAFLMRGPPLPATKSPGPRAWSSSRISRSTVTAILPESHVRRPEVRPAGTSVGCEHSTPLEPMVVCEQAAASRASRWVAPRLSSSPPLRSGLQESRSAPRYGFAVVNIGLLFLPRSGRPKAVSLRYELCRAYTLREAPCLRYGRGDFRRVCRAQRSRHPCRLQSPRPPLRQRASLRRPDSHAATVGYRSASMRRSVPAAESPSSLRSSVSASAACRALRACLLTISASLSPPLARKRQPV